MSLIKIDFDIRKLNSLFLRIILVGNVTIIYYQNYNLFSSETYLLTILGYILGILLNLFLTPGKLKGFGRLILDLLLVGIFLYGKNLNETINFLPYLLLIFNVANHSNRSNRFFLFILLLHISIFITSGFRMIFLYHLIPAVFYFFIGVLLFRRYFRNLNDMMISTISKIYVDELNENTNHHILRDFKSQLERTNLKIFIKIDNVYCFKRTGTNLIPIKGTEFIRTNPMFSQKEKNDLGVFLNHSKNGSTARGSLIYINNRELRNHIWIKSFVKKEQYFFLVNLKERPTYLAEMIIKGLYPIFDYMARIFQQSNTFTNLLKFQSELIKRKITHVLDAQNALHFVNNKLGPISRIMDLIDRYFKEEYESSSKKDYILKELRENKGKFQLKEIKDKAKILIKGVDILLDEEDEVLSVENIIDIVRQNWINTFQNIEGIFVEIETFSDEKVKLNRRLIEFVLIDIIENIRKYSEESGSVRFRLENNNLIIDFNNKIKNFTKELQNLIEIKALYNHTDNDEIYKRKTHGLSFIRRLLRRKDIENRIDIEKSNEMFKFQLILPIYENSNL